MIFLITTALALFAAFSRIFLFTPVDATQGIVQKIFYVHVGCAVTMYIAFFITFLSALLYLFERKLHWDEITVSAAEVGFYLCSVVLLTGPIWAKPTWGAWWVWEPRLTMTFLLWLLYASYLILRGYFGPSARGRVVTSIVAIIAALDMPLIHLSVRLWRGAHPRVIGTEGGLPPSMQATLWLSVLAVFLLFCILFSVRFRLERGRNRLFFLQLQQSEEM